MSVLVEDFLEQGRLQELDPASGRLSAPEGARAREQARGVFMVLGDALVVLHASGTGLSLRIGDDQVPLERATAELEGDDLRTLRILQGGAEVARHRYPNPVHPFMDWDLSLAEEEDFDLGLYVCNVVRSPARLRSLLARWR